MLTMEAEKSGQPDKLLTQRELLRELDESDRLCG